MDDRNYKYGIAPPTLYQDDITASVWNMSVNHRITLDYFADLLIDNDAPTDPSVQAQLAEEAGVYWDLLPDEIQYVEDKVNGAL